MPKVKDDALERLGRNQLIRRLKAAEEALMYVYNNLEIEMMAINDVVEEYLRKENKLDK